MAEVAGLMRHRKRGAGRRRRAAPPVDHDADFDGAEFSGDEGETRR